MSLYTLEDHIYRCWNLVDDLKLLKSMNNREWSRDKIDEFITGLIAIYDLKFEQMFQYYEDMLKEQYQRQFTPEDAVEPVSPRDVNITWINADV